LNPSIPAFREFLIYHLSSPNDRHHVAVVVGLKQRETLDIVEFTAEINGLDRSVKTVKDPEKVCEDTAGGVAVSKTVTPPTCSVCSSHTRGASRKRGTTDSMHGF
jgi:hypothetical protein